LTARRWLRGAGGQNLRQLRLNLRVKYWGIFRQYHIYGHNFGRIVEFEFKLAYKLQVVVQQETLFILRISELRCLLRMNREFFEDFLASLTFS